MPLNPPPSVIKAVSYCMKPMVRVCIDHGIDFRVLSDLLKEIYVKVAEEDFSIPGRKQTDSRISLITGVHRKDVHSIRGEAGTIPTGGNKFANNLITLWLETPELVENNYPLPIPRTAREGYRWSFAQLAARVNQDMPARSLLDELVIKGVLKVDHQDMVYLDPMALIPARNIDQKVQIFSQSIHDHIASSSETLNDRVFGITDTHLEVDGLSIADARKLERIAEMAAKKALKSVSDSAKELKNKTSEQVGTEKTRVSFGTYFYKEK